MKFLRYKQSKSHNKTNLSVKKTASFLLILFFLLQCSLYKKGKSIKTIEIIQFKMNEQEKCWNNGDLECFMESYWKSDSLKFIGKNGVNYGWKTTLNNYKKSYTSKDEMGELEFINNSIEFIDKETIFVIGKWSLKRSKELGNLNGYYSLVWKIKNRDWVIVSDHSS